MRERLPDIERQQMELTLLAAIKKTKEDERRKIEEQAKAEAMQRLAVSQNAMLAEQGNPEAQYQLFKMLLRGNPQPIDIALGIKWLQKAAEHGVTEAQLELATRLRTGRDIPRNEREAEKWLRMAAKSDNADAKLAFEEMVSEQLKTKNDVAEITRMKQEALRKAELKKSAERVEQEAIRKRENTEKLRAL